MTHLTISIGETEIIIQDSSTVNREEDVNEEGKPIVKIYNEDFNIVFPKNKIIIFTETYIELLPY